MRKLRNYIDELNEAYENDKKYHKGIRVESSMAEARISEIRNSIHDTITKLVSSYGICLPSYKYYEMSDLVVKGIKSKTQVIKEFRATLI